jgi:hypothetical protein
MYLHIMVGQNTKNSNAKEITFLNFIWCDVKTHLSKTNVYHIVIPYDWNRFLNHVKILIIIISQMGQNEIKWANNVTLQKDYTCPFAQK